LEISGDWTGPFAGKPAPTESWLASEEALKIAIFFEQK